MVRQCTGTEPQGIAQRMENVRCALTSKRYKPILILYTLVGTLLASIYD
jgi:hypothetical protein